jgi:hypothetical protein
MSAYHEKIAPRRAETLSAVGEDQEEQIIGLCAVPTRSSESERTGRAGCLPASASGPKSGDYWLVPISP